MWTNALNPWPSPVDKAMACVTVSTHLVASVVSVVSAISWQITPSPNVSVTVCRLVVSIVINIVVSGVDM